MKKIKKAIISVSNKDKLIPLLKTLSKYKIKLISSGGTFKKIKKLKYKCIEVSEYTNSPEILNGRVKTLHPKIHAGILSKRNNKSHQKELIENNFDEIDFSLLKHFDGFSNHCSLIEAPIRALREGIEILEIHITSDKTKDFVDNNVSFDYDEIKEIMKVAKVINS